MSNQARPPAGIDLDAEFDKAYSAVHDFLLENAPYWTPDTFMVKVALDLIRIPAYNLPLVEMFEEACRNRRQEGWPQASPA